MLVKVTPEVKGRSLRRTQSPASQPSAPPLRLDAPHCRHAFQWLNYKINIAWELCKYLSRRPTTVTPLLPFPGQVKVEVFTSVP